MNRRDLLLMLVLAQPTLAVTSASAGTVRQPNILLIMTDQQSAEAMSCRIGDTYLKTPAMDSLAATGTVFTRAYCANPLCMPSRTAMFTGRYPHETGVQTNKAKRLDPETFRCLGTVFRAAGYDTGYVGKWHIALGYKKKSERSFDYMEVIKANGGDRDRPGALRKFLQQPRRRPFFLVASFNNPHNICEWARGQQLPDGTIGEPPVADKCPPLRRNHRATQSEPDILSLMRRSYQSSRMFPVSEFTPQKWRQYAWAYYRMIEIVDGHIARVLDALRASGQQQNTLIVFTSDHGDCQGAHGWNQKTVFYDEASRVPLIISWPGVTAVGTSDRLVQTGIDMLPTLCDYAGIPVAKDLPGLSLKATANGATTPDPRKFVVVSAKMVQGEAMNGVTPMPEGRMVRSRRYKYCVYDLGKQRELLIDMQDDPGEMVNLVLNANHRETLEQHRRYLAEWCRERQDPFLQFVPKTP